MVCMSSDKITGSEATVNKEVPQKLHELVIKKFQEKDIICEI